MKIRKYMAENGTHPLMTEKKMNRTKMLEFGI